MFTFNYAERGGEVEQFSIAKPPPVFQCCPAGPFGSSDSIFNILFQDLSLKNSRFSAKTFAVKPRAAIIFGAIGIGVKIKKSATVIPSGEIVATIILRKTQSGLLRLE